MKNVIRYILYLIVLYFFLFNPPMFMFRGLLQPANILLLLSFPLLVIYSGKIKRYIRYYRKEFIFFLFLSFYVLFICLIGDDTKIITRHFLGLMHLFLVIPLLLIIAEKSGFGTNKDIVRALLIVGTIATFFSILCLVSPSFNQIVKNDIIQYSDEDFLAMLEFRGFGLADNLTGNYGFLLGVILALGFINLKDNKWFIPVIPFMFVAILVNARTGIIIALFGVLYKFFSNRNLALPLGIILFGWVVAANIETVLHLLNFSDETIKWITNTTTGIEEAFEAGDLSESGTLYALTNTMVVLPETLTEWIFGRGYDLFRNTQGIQASDVGWIRQLNIGGLIYLITMIVFILYSTRRLYVKSRLKDITLFFFTVIIIVNTKSIIYPLHSCFYTLMMIYFLYTRQATSISKQNVDIQRIDNIVLSK